MAKADALRGNPSAVAPGARARTTKPWRDPAPASRILSSEHQSCISRGYLPVTYCLMHIRAHFSRCGIERFEAGAP